MPLPLPLPPLQPALPPAAAAALASLDLERLERLEQRLALLWEQVQRGDQQQEQRFGDTLVLHSSLREELRTQTDRESLGLWVSGLLEGKLGALRAELEEGDAHRAQVGAASRALLRAGGVGRQCAYNALTRGGACWPVTGGLLVQSPAPPS